MNPDEHIVLPIPRAHHFAPPVASLTFHDPPLDGSMTLPDIWDWHMQHSPHHPLFQFAEADGSVKTLTWAEAGLGMHSAARLIDSRIRARGAGQRIAIFAVSDYITYTLVAMGIMRLGHAVFFVSPRNSSAAVTHLLSAVGVTHLLVGSEHGLQNSAEAALQELQVNGNVNIPDVLQMPAFEDIVRVGLPSDFKPLPPAQLNLGDSAAILHTSGSTAFPTPVPLNHHRLLLWGINGLSFYKEINLPGLRMSTHGAPIFHAMGLLPTTFAATSGLVISTFKPLFPSAPVTATSVLNGALMTKSQRMLTVATFVEEWSRDPAAVQSLKQFEGVMYSGAPLAKEAGDLLVSQGVALNNVYGLAECGLLTQCHRDPRTMGEDWEYLKLVDTARIKFIPDDSGTLFQPHVLPNALHVPNILNFPMDGEPSFAINDWLSRHPTKPGFWKIVDRVDNQIIHSTGEKTNPSPLESILNQDQRVKSTLMFGRGKFNAGVLVDPMPEFRFEPSDKAKLAQYRDDIRPTVEKMNAYAPQHSRVFKEMILVASPDKPVEYTSKLTPRRGATLAAYANEFEALYATVEENTHADTPLPAAWDEASTREFVKSIISNVLQHSVSDTDDIFQRGCDSLQATWIRNTLLHALKKSSRCDEQDVPTGVIYQYPTIESLSAFIARVASAQHPLCISAEDKVTSMLDMVKRYTTDFPKHRGSSPNPTKDIVLLTGSTGGLGSSLLANLVRSPQVVRVYALNRKGRLPLAERQKIVLAERGYDPDIVNSDKVVLLEADLSKRDLDLPSETLSQIQLSITHIMHIAYRVNWNLSLSSFDPDVRAVRNLIDLALCSPLRTVPRLLFSSSIAVLTHLNPDEPPEEAPVAPEVALDNGYSESKWVCERILEVASVETDLCPVVTRVGQIAGNPSGAWNTAEWVPSLIRSSIYIGALPEVKENVSWILSDSAARALLDMRSSREPFLHLAHPRPITASSVFHTMSEELNLPLISLQEWVHRLETSADAFNTTSAEDIARCNPALRLTPFFRNVLTFQSQEAFCSTSMATSKAEKASGSLRPASLPQLTREDILNWLKYWRRIEFL